jgi:hypothetical protein
MAIELQSRIGSNSIILYKISISDIDLFGARECKNGDNAVS